MTEMAGAIKEGDVSSTDNLRPRDSFTPCTSFTVYTLHPIRRAAVLLLSTTAKYYC